MTRTVAMFLCLGGMAVLTDAQVSSPEFEVASVKPAGPLVPSTHTEQRPVNVYVLKMSRADGQLGTQLKRSDPSCAEARTGRQPLPPQCQATATSGFQSRAMQISDGSPMGVRRRSEHIAIEVDGVPTANDRRGR